MAEFITKLDCELYNQDAAEYRGIWRLLGALIYKSDLLTSPIIVPSGFISDYVSIPRIPFIFDLLGDTSTEASVVHDWLYDLESNDTDSRKLADQILLEACTVTGIPFYIRYPIYAGVRLFGNQYYKKRDYAKYYDTESKDKSTEVNQQADDQPYRN